MEMDRNHWAIRLTQPVSDLVHKHTGWTCYRQAALLASIDVLLMGAAWLVAGLDGTLTGNSTTVTLIVLGAISLAKFLRRYPRETAGRRLPPEASMLSFGSFIGSCATVTGILQWMPYIPFAPTGGVPVEVLLGLMVNETAWVHKLVGRDRTFLDRCARGELSADPVNLTMSFYIDVVFSCLLIGNFAAHLDLASGLAGAAGLFIIAATAVGRCRPRPPRSQRQTSKQPWAGFARAGA